MSRHIHDTTKVEDILQTIGSGRYVEGTTNAVADTETTHAHLLDWKPRGMIIISKDKAGDIYDSDSPHTDTEIKIKCSVVSVAFKAWVF